MNPKRTPRKLHMDVLRILAVYLIVFNHTGTYGYTLFTVAHDSVLYPFYLLLAVCTKVAVPLFFMISGALLIGKEESVGTVLTKRVRRFAAVLVLFSLLSFLYQKNWSLAEFSAGEFVRRLYCGEINVSYWYLYAYLAFLLMLPLLRRLAKALTDREFIYLIGMYLLIQCMTIGQFLLWKGEASYEKSFLLFITGSNFFYPMLGYFLEHRVKVQNLKRRQLGILSAAGIVCILCICALTCYHHEVYGDWTTGNFEQFFGTLIFVPAAAVYLGMKGMLERYPVKEGLAKILMTISSGTFGVYLLEGFVRAETIWIFAALRPYLHTLPACLLWVLLVCAICTALTMLLKKLTFLKRIL